MKLIKNDVNIFNMPVEYYDENRKLALKYLNDPDSTESEIILAGKLSTLITVCKSLTEHIDFCHARLGEIEAERPPTFSPAT